MVAKVKVAVLGGGVGAITAAMQLTATPALRARYEVTVYQLGWRLGGKGASGRNADANDRIEEHGLHIWFGFYDNAFRLMRQAYVENARIAGVDELATIEEAFHPCDTVVMYDREGQDWRGLSATAPANNGTPGDGEALPSFWDLVAMTAHLLSHQWTYLAANNANLQLPQGQPNPVPTWLDPMAKMFSTLSVDLALSQLAMFAESQNVAAKLFPLPPGLTPEDGLVQACDAIRDLAFTIVQPYQAGDAKTRLVFATIDVMAASVRGIVKDRVRTNPEGLRSINHLDLTKWLKSHKLTALSAGATPRERTPLLRALYDLAFGYPEGNIDKADIAAGTALNDLLRMALTYRGHMMYKMQGGMGDVVFAPFYEVLVKRGVKFRFFSPAKALRLAKTADRIDEIDIVRQVELTGAYDPLVTVQGLPCWPNQPRWGQLVNGATHKQNEVDFEGKVDPLVGKIETLKRGTHFDEVVLGVSIGGLPGLAAELVQRNAKFAKALSTAVTVRTQAFQLWMRQDAKTLGFAYGADTVVGTYVEPLDTYCDMTHLIARESWPAGDVKSIAYFCGVLDHRIETQQQATARVRTLMEKFTDMDIAGLWPQGVTKTKTPHLEWAKLATWGMHIMSKGPQMLDAQYWRANIGGTELYVLTPAGTVKHRLPSGDTGFENLAAAGDWTKNGIDGGCVEAAAISGIEAANAIIARHLQPGDPAPVPATHAHTDWLKGS
jgi:uncharacterized protein with NAD-binding domain and iron-sulfur cluster